MTDREEQKGSKERKREEPKVKTVDMLIARLELFARANSDLSISFEEVGPKRVWVLKRTWQASDSVKRAERRQLNSLRELTEYILGVAA